MPTSTDPMATTTNVPHRTEPSLTMRAATVSRYGTPDDVVVRADVPAPTPAPGEVLIAVEAASLNMLDWHFLVGSPYLLRPTGGWRRPRRLGPGADVCGVIVALGRDVDGWRVGDRVMGECEKGATCAELVACPADALAAVPGDLPAELVAALPVAGLTALQGLRTHARVQPGERVLVNGAAGGVGTFAVQIAKHLGAHVTAVCSTRNVEMVRELGADVVLDYTTDDFARAREEYDVLVDVVGNRSAADAVGVLRPGGRLVMIGGPKGAWLGPLPALARAALRARRTGRRFHWFVASPNADDLAMLVDLAASGAITPQIDRVVGLDGVAAGLAEIGTGHARAKIVVVPGLGG